MRKTATLNPRNTRVNDYTNIKYIHCSKIRHLEYEYYIKHPEKKVVFDKILTKKKALKKQQVLLKAILSTFVATIAIATTIAPPLPPSVLYKFGNRTRMFIATILPLSLVYTFNEGIHTNIAEIDST